MRLLFSNSAIGLLTVLGLTLLVGGIGLGVFVHARRTALDRLSAIALYLGALLLITARLLGFVACA